MVKLLRCRVVALVVVLVALFAAPCAVAQTGLYVPAKGPVRNMQKALHNPEVFYLLLCYEGSAPTYSVGDLDLLDSAYRIAFDIDNPMYYTMAVEAYGDGNEALGKERVDGVYRYFAMRGGQLFPVRVAHNNIHCSCKGDTVETLRFEVPVTTAVYNAAELPESRRLLNKSIVLQNCVLVTFSNDPDECVGSARGCYVPAEDSIVRGYYASLSLAKGSVRAVDNTKDTCPSGLEIVVEDHLDYRKVVEQYSLVPHRKQIIVQAGYIVVKSNWAQAMDSCTQPQKDSIFVRIPATPEQVAAKLKFFAKVKGKRGEKGGIQIDLLIQTSRVTYIVEVKRRLRIGREIEREIADKVAAFPKRRGISIRTALVYEGELDDAVARSGAFDILLPFPRLLGIEH